jgi:hypothetical protein
LPLLLAVAACSDTKPKVLSNNKISFGGDTDTPETFKFNFAYRDTAATSPLNQIVYLQGAADTKTTLVSTCNAAGTNCVCEFLKSDETEITETQSTDITYDQTGNYFRCNFPGTAAELATLAKVKIRNQNSTVVSAIYDVDTSLTAQKILGDDLNMNYLRTIYRFSCLFNFLQKAGTTSASFDCSDQSSLCGSIGSPNGDFCFLQSYFPYFLYSSNNTTNFDQKKTDQLYNNGYICGLQIKQYDCAGTSGTPVASFAVYGEQKGIFDTAVQMSPGPDAASSTYGYAARTSTFQGNTVCPPGLVRRIFYRAAVTPNTGWLGSNMTATTTSEVAAPGSTVADLGVFRVKGGDCSGTACTLPGTADGQMGTFPYSSTGETEFCVIPTSLLP